MKGFIFGFAAFPLLSEILPRALKFIEPFMDYLNNHPLWALLAGPLVLLVLIDWDWRRNLSERYGQWKWDRKHRLLRELQRELGID